MAAWDKGLPTSRVWKPGPREAGGTLGNVRARFKAGRPAGASRPVSRSLWPRAARLTLLCSPHPPLLRWRTEPTSFSGVPRSHTGPQVKSPQSRSARAILQPKTGLWKERQKDAHGSLPASAPLHPLRQRPVPGSARLTAPPWRWRQVRSHCPHVGGGGAHCCSPHVTDGKPRHRKATRSARGRTGANAGAGSWATWLQGPSPRGELQASPGELGLGRPPAARAPVRPPPNCRGVWTRLLLAGQVGEGQGCTISTGRVAVGALRRYLLLHRLATAITGPGQTAHEQGAHSGCSGQWGGTGGRPCGVTGTRAVPHTVTHFLQPKKSLTERRQVRRGR